MWAFLVGVFGGRVLRDGRAPDSVKQDRYDTRVARRSEKRSRIAETRSRWGPAAWIVLAGVAVAVVLLLR